MTTTTYVGRFAPSPTGPLHLGSLATAVASFLDARAHRGRWLLRIEDIDPPREVPGAAATIAGQLDAHGLHWDGAIVHQSQRLSQYERALAKLAAAGLLYRCTCNRQRLRELGGRYDGRCRQRTDAAQPGALRVRIDGDPQIDYRDFLRGPEHTDLRAAGDFVVRRRDGLIAYQLAVAVDDAAQGVTHVLRGADLADSTPRQIFLFRQLGLAAPEYGHIPVICDAQGRKLSKQNSAPEARSEAASDNLCRALAWLGLTLPRELEGSDPETLLRWGLAHWHRGHSKAEAP